MRNFKELKIWQKGFEIAMDSYSLILTFPSSEKYGLNSQITRAAVSIPSNIAEGSSRKSDRDYRRFIEIALGSSFELETQIMIANTAGFYEPAVSTKLLIKVSDEQKMLSSFMNSLI